MLMEIDPLPMRGSLAMMMVMISPSWREVSPAEQLRQSPRLVPPRFHLVAAEFRLRRWLMIIFSSKEPIQQKMVTGGPPGGPRGRGRAQGVGRAPHPRGCLGTLLAHLRCSVGFFWSKNDLHEILGQLDSVWFSFSVILKNKEKQKLALVSRLIGQSQKSYKIAYKCI